MATRQQKRWLRHWQRVFDPFFTTKQVGKGTGQGLAICHDVITQKLDGSMSVTSKKDTGTTFIIRLPSVMEETDIDL